MNAIFGYQFYRRYILKIFKNLSRLWVLRIFLLFTILPGHILYMEYPYGRPLKGFKVNGQILKGIGDTFVKIQITLRDMVIQSFLKLGEFLGYLPISFKGYGILFKIFKVIWDTWDPLPGPHMGTCMVAQMSSKNRCTEAVFHLNNRLSVPLNLKKNCTLN